MTYTISKEYHFSASHQLKGLALNHPCMRLHGHNYRVEVVCQAARLDEHGFVVDYGDIDVVVGHYIDKHLDHRHLNEVLGDMNTTAERIAHHLFRIAFQGGLPVVAVRVSETPKTWAEYRNGNEA